VKVYISRVFKNKVLRRIFGPERERKLTEAEEESEWRKELYTEAGVFNLSGCEGRTHYKFQ
jgi:hypothetical protein